MNVQQLIDLRQDTGTGAEVLMADQPCWPLPLTVAGVYRAGECDETADGDVDRDDKAVVDIVEGQHRDASRCAPEAA